MQGRNDWPRHSVDNGSWFTTQFYNVKFYDEITCMKKRCCSSKAMRRHLILLSLLTVVSIFCVMWTLPNLFHLENTQYTRVVSFNIEELASQKKVPKFDMKKDWCRLQKWRVEWESMLTPCRGKLEWNDREANSKLKTNALRSYVKAWRLKPAGKFSRFFIQSVTTEGNMKTAGGDSWRVYIRQGPSSLAPLVLDLNNGLYEVLFLAAVPGVYHAQVYLDYSLCDGLRDPPEKWFVNGTDHGTYRHAQEGILGYIGDDHIIQALNGKPNLSFNIEASEEKLDQKLYSVSCDQRCRMLWDGHGYWVHKQWTPYLQKNAGMNGTFAGIREPRPRKLGTLWVYGDSIGLRFLESIRKRALCRRMFQNCTGTYNWLYEVQNKKAPFRVDSDFNHSIVVDQIKSIIERPEMNRLDSVFLFNLGVHFPISLNFQSYRKVMDAIIELLNTQEGGAKKYKCLVIWKSTTAIEKEKVTRFPWPAQAINYTMLRFFTMPRVQLFHSYAMQAMCHANIRVLDVHPISAAYPQGTLDYVHYEDHTFKPVEDLLEELFITRSYLYNNS